MIDILTILLIFFIVHTQWKKPQSLLKIDVPGAEFMEGAPSTEQRAVLAVTGKSSISLNGNLVEMNELAAALESLKREKPDVKLQLDVDKKAEFGVIVGIWDALTSVGIDAGDVPARIEINKSGAQ
ncbi:biopolymer transporter ExbD [Akkermansia sp. Marseille-P9185]|nr:biopolymer transporter ExbD [Akkermansia sp. GGCC_0220]MBT8774041.1 biopolymer transporter ExbD [Akkermansia muciniphila]MCM0684542.1 biopolymer transporter ExbD [Akkermansia sp. B2-R-115]MCO8186036.1 biopolymer transporter ExbD [Akkermansia massiliensis]